MKLHATYSLKDRPTGSTTTGEADINLNENELSVYPEEHETIVVPLPEILDLTTDEYRLEILLSSDETLTLADLGYQFEDLLRELTATRNENSLTTLLMGDTLKKSGLRGEYSSADTTGKTIEGGKTEIRLYETALVLLPDKGNLIRLPISSIAAVTSANYVLRITTDFGIAYNLHHLGEQFDQCKKLLIKTINEQSAQTQKVLKELLPDLNPLLVRKAAALLKDGKVVRKKDLEMVSKTVWQDLEKKLASLGMGQEYQFLASYAPPERICIGMKRGLMGDLTKNYLWLLIPIYCLERTKPGNVIVMEAVDATPAAQEEEKGKRATYLFRIVSPKEYEAFSSQKQMDEKVDEAIKTINRGLVAINFRREPIYVSDEKLDDPRYSKYRLASKKIPELQTIRTLFLGRIIHSSFEAWKEKMLASLNDKYASRLEPVELPSDEGIIQEEKQKEVQ